MAQQSSKTKYNKNVTEIKKLSKQSKYDVLVSRNVQTF